MRSHLSSMVFTSAKFPRTNRKNIFCLKFLVNLYLHTKWIWRTKSFLWCVTNMSFCYVWLVLFVWQILHKWIRIFKLRFILIFLHQIFFFANLTRVALANVWGYGCYIPTTEKVYQQYRDHITVLKQKMKNFEWEDLSSSYILWL